MKISHCTKHDHKIWNIDRDFMFIFSFAGWLYTQIYTFTYVFKNLSRCYKNLKNTQIQAFL